MKCNGRASCYSWLGVMLAGCCELQTKGGAITSQHNSMQCAGAQLCTLGILSSTSTLQQSLVSHIPMQIYIQLHTDARTTQAHAWQKVYQVRNLPQQIKARALRCS